ncbi:MAG: tetratricopeptide repeat protein [Candidatus Brocadiae bacterium]|nr:tetratricopeptide repeat protein [Candidatus Brocadiia bacterium]
MDGEKNYAKWFLPALIVMAIGIVVWDVAQKNLSQNTLPKATQDSLSKSSGQLEKQIAEAYQKGDWQKAAQMIEDVLKMQPDRNKDMRYSLIQIYLQFNMLTQAKEHLKICFEKLGKVPELLFIEAQISLREGETDKSYQIFQEIVTLEPQFLPARIGMVEISLGKKAFKEALLQIQEIQKKFPDALEQIAHIYLFEADIHFSMEDFEKARLALENFLNIHPNIFGVHRDWIEAACALGQLSEAQKKYQEKWESQDSKERLFYQQLYAMTIPPQKAIDLLEGLLSKDPSPSIRMGLISLWTKEGEYEKAIQSCMEIKGMQDVLEEKRLSWLGHAIYLSGDSAQARKIYTEILANPQAKAHSFSGLINLELLDKNFPVALSHIKELLEDSKNKQDRWNTELLKSRVLYEAGQWEDALSNTQKLLDDIPSGIAVHSHALYKKAQILFAQGKLKEAGEIFAEIAEKKTRANDLRLKSALWHGIALYLQGIDPTVTWEKYRSFGWQNYMTDDRMKLFFELFLGKEKPENTIFLKKMPFLANDICFFLGFYYEMQKNYQKAYENYEEGLQSSKGCDFPWHELTAAKKRVSSFQEK